VNRIRLYGMTEVSDYTSDLMYMEMWRLALVMSKIQIVELGRQ